MAKKKRFMKKNCKNKSKKVEKVIKEKAITYMLKGKTTIVF